jgi:TrmH family RNA methyltransferase
MDAQHLRRHQCSCNKAQNSTVAQSTVRFCGSLDQVPITGMGCKARRIRLMPERITSRTNPRVRALRAALSPRRGDALVGIEGFHLVREAVASGLVLQTLFVREDRESSLRELPPDVAEEIIVLSAGAFESAAGTESSQGIAAVLERPEAAYAPRTGDLLLLADGLQDPGNLGTLIRSAEAFGAAAVAMTAGTVDPWNGKCLRAAAGAAFRMPLPAWDAGLLSALRAVNAQLYAAVPRDATPAHVADLAGTVVLMIGNEGAGISPALIAEADACITLQTTGPTESLNAAVAGSLLLYEASQQRAKAFRL